MYERDALLAAIEAAPGDDAPRLIFADWLDEHGGDEGARVAAWIRRILARPRGPVVAAEVSSSADWCEGGRIEAARRYFVEWTKKPASPDAADAWTAVLRAAPFATEGRLISGFTLGRAGPLAEAGDITVNYRIPLPGLGAGIAPA
jgi:uncharacterized protein (TIGR02996 family)